MFLEYLAHASDKERTTEEACWRVQTSVRKTGKTNVEILYVVFIRMLGELILEDRKVGQYGPDRNQCHLFFSV